MLLNHKAAIEFMVDAVPLHGLTSAVIGSLHALLMEHLLAHTDGLGPSAVPWSTSATRPTSLSRRLCCCRKCSIIVEKARLIKNPVEAAFFSG